MLPPLEILSEEKKIEMIKKLKKLNFYQKKILLHKICYLLKFLNNLFKKRWFFIRRC